MRIVRIAHAGRAVHAVHEGDELAILGDLFVERPRLTGERIPAADVQLLAPVAPGTVFGMAHNTGAGDRELPMQAFFKPVGSVIGPGSAIPIPAGIGKVDVEGELAVVIGRPARHLTLSSALSSVLGYTIGNDVTARDLQRTDPLWTAAKGRDGFTPLGPWIETDLDPHDVSVAVSINGVALRPASTTDLARGVREILVYLTSLLTLRPGDVILTGAPGEPGPVRPGDTVDITIDRLGTITNPVVTDPCPHIGAP
jgi:2-keto-4-pentenoate hydratase/2-oxohepta-3-ene-1,7-dioic acid hydratase in catechol pathway